MTFNFATQLYTVENTPSVILASTYTVWNILNFFSRKHDSKYRYQRGHIRPMQARELLNMILSFSNNSSQSISYCEIGFNAGHSTSLALIANPSIKITTFDLMNFQYSHPIINMLNESFNSRINLYKGRSSDTLPMACRQHLKCDVVFLDGSHLQYEVMKDLENLKCLVKHRSLIMIDDIQTASGTAMEKQIDNGAYKMLRRFGPYRPNHKLNPCMTTPYGPLCFAWGFAILEARAA